MRITTKIIEQDKDGNKISEQIITEEREIVVTNAQLRLALIDFGLFEVVDSAIRNSGDIKLITLWDYANTISSDHPSVIQLKQALNITDEQYQLIFEKAQSL